MDTLVDTAPEGSQVWHEADAFDAQVSGLQHNGWMTFEGYLLALGFSPEEFRRAS